ncbi:MAG TPA: MBOAT family O-acyltransferase [Chryseolinea sp.]|nr:MBOAT family O-acyltransferase [Chryseolinea sp.]
MFQRNFRAQNIFILAASYFFYGWWDWRFVSLLILSTLIDYAFGLAINRTSKRKLYLWLSIVNNLTILGFFKYYDFFASSFQDVALKLGFTVHPYFLDIVLPVGISFYTFHGMSYVFDIYNGKVQPTKDFVQYAVFVSFFPLLVAGPIERASHLLPQVQKPRQFNYDQAMDGMRLILWGLFKKVVVADSLAIVVNEIFASPSSYSGSTLVLGAVCFAFQIYGDFSGYTDIALGTAKLLGFELLTNFRFPYFSRDIAEFWRRWHISLSSWFRDYVYVPLGGSKQGPWISIRNIFVIFLLSGFWHGAKWTYLVWGGFHALLYVPLFLFGVNRQHASEIVAAERWLPTVREMVQILGTFVLVTIGWVFFRADSVTSALSYFAHIPKGILSIPQHLSSLGIIAIFLVLDWTTRRSERKPHPFIPAVPYVIALLLILLVFGKGGSENIEFIYFQF